MDGPPYARPAVATASGSGGFSRLSGRRRADNAARVPHNLHAAITPVTAATVTDFNFKAGNITAVTVATVTAFTFTTGNVTVVTSAAVTAVMAVTVTAFTFSAGKVKAVGVTALGAAAGVWPCPLEDGPVFIHADDALLGNAGEGASPTANEKTAGLSVTTLVSCP